MAVHLILAILAWSAAPAESAVESEVYFRPQDANAVIELFEDVGYEVIRGDTIWIRDPNTFAIRMFVYDTPDAPVSAVRFYVQFDIGDSEAALEQALHYEQTNLMAEISTINTESGRQIVLKRDVLFAGGRTRNNVIANAQLLFQLTPVFASYLAQADQGVIPALQRGVQP